MTHKVSGTFATIIRLGILGVVLIGIIWFVYPG